MTPDRNLAVYAQSFVPRKEVLLWPGFCPTHHRLNLDEILELKRQHPKALVAAHPECQPKFLEQADIISSTSGIIANCGKSEAQEFVILTECGVLHPLKKQNPGKTFYEPKTPMVCPNMKKNTVQDIVKALETLTPVIKVPEEIRIPALAAVERMMAVPRD
jgi:quinolinate synthase